MGYFDNDKKILNASQKEPLLPLFESSFNFSASYFLPRSTLRQREKYILFLILLCFVIFLIGGVFFLPELKAGKQFAYKHISKAGSDFIGLPNPNKNGPKPFFDLPIPNSQVIDKQKFEQKFNEIESNVLPKPNLNKNNNLKAVLDPQEMKLPSEFNIEEDNDPDYRRETIKEMMLHAWNNYVKYAWGYNELRPISRQGHSAGIFGTSRLGASVIDGLDTLLIMGLKDEYLKAREFVEKNLDFDSLKTEISVFEFNIRFVGGLLSAYALTKDQLFVKKADEIAQKLLPAFETKTGIPYGLINTETGEVKNYRWASSNSILSEFGTMHLEFVYLSYLTGKPIYKEKVEKVRNFLEKIEKKDGLYYNYINPTYGTWGQAHVSIGALGDSFYEYLLKSYLQTNQKDEQAFKMYYAAIDSLLAKTKAVSKEGLFYLNQLKYDKLIPKMEHLGCFAGGLFALGGKILNDEEKKKYYISIGENFTNTCHESYTRSATKLGPETFEFSENSPVMRSTEYQYLQRPEVIESYFYLWRITKDPKYRDWAWEAALAIQKYCRVDNGFSGIKNVYSKNPAKDDVQQSYLLSETFKYLYLIFSDDSLISLDKWVFNSEGHPLPIADKNSAYMLS